MRTIWYTATVAPPTDPNLLYDTRAALDPFGVLRSDEIAAVVAVLLAMSEAADHGRIHAALAPAVDRFGVLDDEDTGELRRITGVEVVVSTEDGGELRIPLVHRHGAWWAP